MPNQTTPPPEHPPKLRISRLPLLGNRWGNPPSTGASGSDRGSGRVSHACERCRKKKAKCNGGRPSCATCRELGIACYYGDRKREAEKKRVGGLEERVELYEKLLIDVQSHIKDSDLQTTIQKVLNKDGENSNSSATPAASTIEEQELHTDADRVSIGPVDCTNQDLNTSSFNNPFGYLGKTSGLWWIQRAREEIGKELPTSAAPGHQLDPRVPTVDYLNATLYHLDDLGMPESENHPTPFSIPLKEISDVLLDSYFSTVHPMFPLVHKASFLNVYTKIHEGEIDISDLSRKWLAIFNIILAIGRSHCNLTQDKRAGHETEADYFLKARMLGALDGGSLFDVPDLQQIQMLGLTAKYLLANHRFNRAWSVSGLAIRQAHALGLHLNNDAPHLNLNQKEVRLCIWHALYSIEVTLVMATGRPPAIREEECSVPVPSDITDEHGTIHQDEDGKPVPDYYFFAQRKLFALISDAITTLYTAKSLQKSVGKYQREVEEFEGKLAQWKSELPKDLDFVTQPVNETGSMVERKRFDLALRFHNIRMLVHRPFLCLMDERIPGQSEKSKDFNLMSAQACINSAREVVHIITSKWPTFAIKNGPWWCMIHFITTAGAVLLLELAFHAKHSNAAELFEEGKRITDWLSGMREVDLASRRSFIVFKKLFRLLHLTIGHTTVPLLDAAEGSWCHTAESDLHPSGTVWPVPVAALDEEYESQDLYELLQTDLRLYDPSQGVGGLFDEMDMTYG